MSYPIESDTPVMLRFPTAFHEQFATRHAERLSALDGYRPPGGEPRPGEEAIQETITTQWETVQEDELSFSCTMDALVALNRRVWLQWIADLPEDESARARS